MTSVEQVAGDLRAADNLEEVALNAAAEAEEHAVKIYQAGFEDNAAARELREAISAYFANLRTSAEGVLASGVSDRAQQANSAYEAVLDGSQEQRKIAAAADMAASEAEHGETQARDLVETIDAAEQQLLGVFNLALGSIATRGQVIWTALDDARQWTNKTVEYSQALVQRMTAE